jgi:AcrR family transcriptional regulator
MSYEVIKTIGGRKYRYDVESYRDPETGKVRNKWRYAGKAEGGAPPRHRRRAHETRDALMGALEALLEHTAWHEVTVRAIAQEATLAEATFYRYFKSRDDLLLACAHRLIEESDARLASLSEIEATVGDERRRLRERAVTAFTNPHGNAVFFALWVTGGSEELRQRRFERRRVAFLDYLRLLTRRGYVVLDNEDIETMAKALAVFAQALSYRTVIERRPLEADESDAIGLLIERTIFT